MNEETRRFSLEKDFMNYDTDALIYGYIQYLATYMPEKQTLYVPIEKIKEHKKMMSEIIGKSVKTVERHIEDLFEKNLLVKEELKINDKKTLCAIVPQRTDGLYQIIKRDILWYIIVTRNKFALKIYIYLLNKKLWKDKTNEKYIFTATELGEALGYTSAKNHSEILAPIEALLQSFNKEGIIKFNNIIKVIDGKPVKYKELIYVCENLDELN